MNDPSTLKPGDWLAYWPGGAAELASLYRIAHREGARWMVAGGGAVYDNDIGPGRRYRRHPGPVVIPDEIVEKARVAKGKYTDRDWEREHSNGWAWAHVVQWVLDNAPAPVKPLRERLGEAMRAAEVCRSDAECVADWLIERLGDDAERLLGDDQ